MVMEAAAVATVRFEAIGSVDPNEVRKLVVLPPPTNRLLDGAVARVMATAFDTVELSRLL
jgi:hypothetical protein